MKGKPIRPELSDRRKSEMEDFGDFELEPVEFDTASLDLQEVDLNAVAVSTARKPSVLARSLEVGSSWDDTNHFMPASRCDVDITRPRLTRIS